MNKNPKYDNDLVVLGYLNKRLEETQKALNNNSNNELSKLPKNYSAPPTTPYYKDSLLCYNGKIYKCHTSRLQGLFSWDDWNIVATDDTTLSNFINNVYEIEKIEIQNQIDGKIQTYYQSADPALEWETDLEKSKHIGDYWYNTDDNTQWRYNQNTNTTPISYYWGQVNIPNSVFDLIDKKKSIYTEKPTSYKKDDLWIIEDTILDEDLPTGTYENPIAKGDWVFSIADSDIYNKEHWVKKDENIDLKYLEQHYYTMGDINSSFEELERNTDSKIEKSKENILLNVSQNYATKEEHTTAINDFDEKIGIVNQTITTHETNISNLSIEVGKTQQTVSSIETKTKDLEINLNNNYTANEELEQKLEKQKSSITTEMTSIVTQTKNEVKTEIITQINNDGVETLKNTLVTINQKGINVAKSDEDVVSLLDNEGLYVSDGTLNEDNSNLLMKTDRDGAYFKTINVQATIKENSLIQKEKITHSKYGVCQAWYWVGDSNG